MSKCIYCNNSDDLSESDIIPDALTNVKIKNRNVCRIEHNNKFSDMFESEVINALAFITNELDIKSSKAKHFPTYEAMIGFNDDKYPRRISSDTQLFGHNIFPNENKTHLIGPIDEMRKIAGERQSINAIDVNATEVDISVNCNISIFFSLAMFRTIAKIAYEWYCLKNGISEKYENFNDVIHFILTGENAEKIVKIVETKTFYDMINTHCQQGSHCIVSFIDKNNHELSIFVNFLGLVTYRVRLCAFDETICRNNCIYNEFLISGIKKEVTSASFESLCKDLKDSFREMRVSFISCMIPKNMSDTSLVNKLFLCNIYELIYCDDIELVDAPTRILIDNLRKNLDMILQSSVLHKKSIKRFVKEHFTDMRKKLVLNPNGTNKKNIFMFYVLFLIGESDFDEIDYDKIAYLIKNDLGESGREYILSDELCADMRDKMLKNDYDEIIKRGVTLINQW